MTYRYYRSSIGTTSGHWYYRWKTGTAGSSFSATSAWAPGLSVLPVKCPPVLPVHPDTAEIILSAHECKVSLKRIKRIDLSTLLHI